MSPARKAELILVMITLIWGTTFVFIKNSLEYTSTFVFLTIRFLLAALFLRIWFHQALKDIPPATWIAGGIIGLFLSAGNFFQTAGLGITTASKSAFFTSTVVVYVPMISVFIAKERLKLSSIISVMIVTAGLFLLTSPQGQGFNLGDFLTIFCAMVFAFQLVFVQVFSRKFQVKQLVYVEMVTNFILSIPLIFIFDGKDMFLHLHWKLIALLVYLSVIAAGVVFFLQMRYQRDTTATKAAIIYCLEPLFASTFAYFTIGETFTTVGLIGAGVVIAGILMSELARF
jgi:drug/metabolite transporter (DMT)-like permease